MYRVRILKAATRDLAKLDESIGCRLVDHINWLVENFDNIKPEVLSGSLSEFYKLRASDYRVIYEILQGERIIVIHQVGHYKEICR